MYFLEYEGEHLIGLTFEDEKNLAQSVMDCLALRWVQGDFSRLLDTIYYIKCAYGSMIREDDLLELIRLQEFWNLPVFEVVSEDDQSIWTELDGQFDDNAERSMECRRMVILAWREVWDRHDAHKAVADAYKRFPGDDVREIEARTGRDLQEEQRALDKMFWDEVDKKEAECRAWGLSVSRHDIIIDVADYIPRNAADLE